MPRPAAARPPFPCLWLRELAAGYLLGPWKVSLRQRSGLWGYVFARRWGRSQVGFFVGFATRPPECVVFAFVPPAAGRLYRHWVRREGSSFRLAYDLLTKYTARRPRFEFHDGQARAVLRRVPLAEFPARQREKYARNFFTESLALLVRSGLPAALASARLGSR